MPTAPKQPPVNSRIWESSLKTLHGNPFLKFYVDA